MGGMIYSLQNDRFIDSLRNDVKLAFIPFLFVDLVYKLV